MYDFVFRWCWALREQVCKQTGSFDPDMSRYAMALSPQEYAEFCDDIHRRLFRDASGELRIVGVAIVGLRSEL